MVTQFGSAHHPIVFWANLTVFLQFQNLSNQHLRLLEILRSSRHNVTYLETFKRISKQLHLWPRFSPETRFGGGGIRRDFWQWHTLKVCDIIYCWAPGGHLKYLHFIINFAVEALGRVYYMKWAQVGATYDSTYHKTSYMQILARVYNK